MATRVVGFDIGSRHVRAVVLETSLRGFTLVELIEERILEPEVDEQLLAEETADEPGEETAAPDDVRKLFTPGVTDAIRRVLQRPNFEFDALCATLPEGVFFITSIELPFSGDKEIRAVLAPQLDGKLPGDVDELHLDYMRAGKSPEGAWRIFAGGIPQTTMAELIGGWEECEANPRIIDVQPFPLFSASEWILGPSSDDARAIVDFGANFTRILIARNGIVELARVIPGGGEDLTRALAQHFSLDEDQARDQKHRDARLLDPDDTAASEDARRCDEICREALKPTIRDLRRTLAAHAATATGPVTSIHLCGGASALQGLDAFLQQSLGAPVTRLSLTRSELSTLPNIAAIGHRFVTAFGVALRGTATSPASTFNLRRGPWAFRGAYEYITARLPALLVMGAALLISLIFFLFARNALMKAEYNAASEGLATLSRQVLGTEITDPAIVRARVGQGVEGPGLHPEASAYDMVVRISNAAQTTVDNQMPMELTGIDVDMVRRQAKISGVCESANTADTFGRNLQADDCLQNVQRSTLTQRRSDQKFEFSYTATVNCRPSTAETSADSNDEGEAP